MVDGQVSVDTTGMVTLKLTGVKANMTYAVEFCPAVRPTATTQTSCIDLGDLSTDGSGNSNTTVKFPQPGSWAGDFDVNSGSQTVYQTWIGTGMSGETYMSTLQPESTANGGDLGSAGLAQGPLTSGTVTFANAEITFTLTGASANTTYTTTESETVYLDGSGSYALNSFTTDAKGDGSTSTELNDPGGDIFEVGPQNPQTASFIGGFSVPQ